MGKNHRHKKDLKAEKAKVKLKQTKTKFLPKGQNVTDTSFKIKAIVLPEQLKTKDAEVLLSKRKLNVKDLLLRLKHYNENVKSSACEDLTEMVKNFPQEIVQKNLAEVCLTVSSLMQDKEHKVRKMATKVIDAILENISKENLYPFLDYFSANLRCAMTNINRNIQEDSLLFLDCFINNDCGLVTKTSEKLLPDFFTLISKLRTDSALGRTLTLNLGSKMTSVAWRIKILTRLHAILTILLGKSDLEKIETKKTFLYTENNYFFQIYNESCRKLLENNRGFAEFLSTKSDVSILNRHIISLVPLLYETWIEAMPEQKVKKLATENTILNEETSALLLCIMNTLYLLKQFVSKISSSEMNEELIFMSPEGKKFLNHLLVNFPYSKSENRNAKKSKQAANSLKILDFNSDPKCTHENLLICFLYSSFFVNFSQNDLKNNFGKILEYLTKILFQKNTINSQNSKCIIEFLSECLGKNHEKWAKRGVNLNTMLENAILFYDHGKINTASKLQLFDILSNIIDNQHLKSFPKYKMWLSNLPNMLCEPEINDKSVRSLLDLSKKNSRDFHESVKKSLPEILGNLDKIKINSSNNNDIINTKDTTSRQLIYIFYYVSNFTDAELDVLRDYIQNGTSDLFKTYIAQMLQFR